MLRVACATCASSRVKIKAKIKISPTKNEIMNNTLANVRSVRRRTKKRDEAINAEPLQPRQHTEANANAAAAIGENVGIIERRTKERHEAINAAPLQPPQQGEADANPDATIDALADPSTQVNPKSCVCNLCPLQGCVCNLQKLRVELCEFLVQLAGKLLLFFASLHESFASNAFLSLFHAFLNP
ncbi:hypothetical protein PIB30_075772 [Stylosanthes scabra]|uniref:Uncharacterized protein n=1 Tax=Stylosanthes scabra TaxID=79078 RepID=A0ABU6UPK0_9FABA|nr:hypothetical protein [Stylosanthes scabra]